MFLTMWVFENKKQNWIVLTYNSSVLAPMAHPVCTTVQVKYLGVMEINDSSWPTQLTTVRLMIVHTFQFSRREYETNRKNPIIYVL